MSEAALTLLVLQRRIEDADGHLRERAVGEVLQYLGIDGLPLLLPRLNDWVVQVREAALQAVTSLLIPAHAPRWVSILPEILKLSRGQRADHGPLLQHVAEFLNGPGQRPALMFGMRFGDVFQRGACLQLLARADWLPTEQLVEWLLAADNVALRKPVCR